MSPRVRFSVLRILIGCVADVRHLSIVYVLVRMSILWVLVMIVSFTGWRVDDF